MQKRLIFLFCSFCLTHLFSLEFKKHVPERLCFDTSKPVSEDEDVILDKPLIGNEVFRKTDIAFLNLPNEVQEVITSMTGCFYESSYFYLSVTLTDDPVIKNRTVKTYTYTPQVYDENLNVETLATSYWIFKRQDNQLKLEFADLNNVCDESCGSVASSR